MAVDPEKMKALIPYLESLEQAFAEGDKGQLVHAINCCAIAHTALPDWAAKAFHAAYCDVMTGRKSSWDTVFGRPFPKGTRVATRSRNAAMQGRVYLLVSQLHKQGMPIDAGLFERVAEDLQPFAKEIGYGNKPPKKSTIEKMFYAERRSFND